MTPQTNTSTILIIDDTPSNLSVVMNLFEERGYRVSIAQDGAEGLQRAQLVRPDLILLDIMMPEMDGFETCRRLKANPITRDIPVIFMTALASIEHKVMGFRAGAVDYVTKPLQIDEVMARVDTHLKLNAAQKWLEQYSEELEQRVEARTAELAETNRLLREREQAIRAVVENSPDAIARYDKQFRRIYINPATQKLFDLPTEEILGKTPGELESVPRGVFMEMLQLVFEHGQELKAELPFHRANGERAWGDIRIVPEFGPDGSVVTVLSIGRDITERKTIERLLYEQAQEIRALVDNSPDTITRYDLNCRRIYANPRVFDEFGGQHERILGTTPGEFPGGESAIGYQRCIERVLATKRASEYEFSWQAADGREIICYISLTPEFDPDGNLVSVLAIGRDITQRKQAEVALRESEEKYRTLIQKLQVAVVVHGPDTQILTTNAVAQEILGLSEDQLYGKTAIDPEWHFYREDGSRTPVEEYPVNQVLASGLPLRNYVLGVHRPDRDDVWSLVNADPVLGKNGEITQVIVTFIDVTQRKHAENALKESEWRYREIFENVSDSLYLVEATPDGRFRNLAFNTAFEKSTGISRENLIGKYVGEAVADGTLEDETAQSVIAKYRHCIEAGAPIEEESVLDLPRGRRYYYSTLVPLRDETGRICRILGLARDMTDIRRVEREFRTLAENIPDHIVRFDTHARMTYVNPTVARLMGSEAGALIGKQPEETPPEIRGRPLDGFASKLRHVLETGEAQTHEMLLRHPLDGMQILDVKLVAERDALGDIVGALGVGRDVTTQKAVEAALRESELQFRTLTENSPEMIVRYDHDCRRVYINPAYEQQTGIPLKNALNKTPFDVWKPLMSRDEYIARIQRVMDTGEPDHILLEWLGDDGRMVSHEMHAVAEYDDAGRAVSTLVIGRNITELKRVEAALRDSELQFRTLTEHMPDVVARYDSACRYIYCNPQMLATIGKPAVEILGKTPVEIRDDEFIRRYQEKLEEVLRTGQETDMIHLLPLRHGGRMIHDHVRFVPEFDSAGQVVSVLAIGRDVSEFKEVERQLRTLIENLPDFVMRLDVDGRYLYVSPAVCAAFGLAAEHFLGKSVPEVDLTGDLVDNLALHEDALRCAHESIPTMREMTFRNPSGDRVFDIMYVPERDETGLVVSVLAVARDITARKRAEEALAVREREFRTLAENAPDCIARYDHEARVVYMNPLLEQAFGVTTEEVLGKCPSEAFPQNATILQYQEALEQVIRTGMPDEIEMVGQAVDGGAPQYDLIHFAPELDGDGRVVGVIAISRNYTEQKRLEQELLRREREFRTLAENSPDVIVRYDRDLHRVYFNQAYLKLGGAAAAAALAKTPQESWWMKSPTADKYTACLRRAIETGAGDELLMESVDADGSPVYHMLTVVPELDVDNHVTSVLAIGHDVTGIKRMEAMLRKSELEFRTLAENSPEMIVRYDREFRRIYLNPAYEQQTGIPLESAWNKTLDDVWIYLMPLEEYKARLKNVMETGEPDRLLLEWYGANGELVSHDMHAVAEYDESGDAIGVLVIGHNITDLKATERRLQESRLQLRTMTAQREAAREEERKRIAREIHDELGQLLNVLRLNVTTLDYRFGGDNPDLHDKAGKMVATVDRAIMMVRSLATRLRPAVLSAGLGSALEWMVHEFSDSTGITCELHRFDDEIPLDEDRAMVVFRIVQESLTNVLRHSGADHVEITLQLDDTVCVVEVHDNGKGFDQASGRRNSFGIVGMRERALMLGGDLEITSEAGEGTVLRLRIPIDEAVDGV